MDILKWISFTLLLATSAAAMGQDGLCKSYIDSIKGEVFVRVDVMPEYPGGIGAMSTHIGKVAYSLGLEAQAFIDSVGVCEVFIQFVVEPDGSLTSRKIFNAENEELSLAVSAALETMSNWTPGSCDGQNVPVRMTIPITFRRQ